MKFYAYPESLYCAKVRVALDVKGLAYEELPPPDGYGSEAYKKIISAGSLLGLLHEGHGLFDSNAILEYIEDIAPTPALLPEQPADRALVRALLGLHDTRIEPSIRAFYAPIKAGKEPGAEEYAPLALSMNEAFARLESLIIAEPYAVGPHVTLVDCAYAATFAQAQQLAQMFKAELRLGPKCKRWWQALQSLEPMANSIDINRKGMQQWTSKFLKVSA